MILFQGVHFKIRVEQDYQTTVVGVKPCSWLPRFNVFGALINSLFKSLPSKFQTISPTLNQKIILYICYIGLEAQFLQANHYFTSIGWWAGSNFEDCICMYFFCSISMSSFSFSSVIHLTFTACLIWIEGECLMLTDSTVTCLTTTEKEWMNIKFGHCKKVCIKG